MSYISVKETSEILDLSEQYVRRLLSKGIIPGKKVSNSWVVDDSVLENGREFYLQREKPVNDQKREEKNLPKIVALSFFSGAMGLDLGLEEAGIDILLTSEIDDSTRKTILLNKPKVGLIGDIRDYSSEKIKEYANIPSTKDIDLIVGGPPCQAFSTAGKRKGLQDERGNVFLTFIDRILELRPKYAVIENVRGLLSAPLEHRPHSKRGFGYPPLTPEEQKGGALYSIINILEENGYTLSFNLYNSANFGSPQVRERLIIICSRENNKPPYLIPTHSQNGDFSLPKWRTFKDVTSDFIEEEQEHINFPDSRLVYYRMLKPGQYWKHLPKDLQKEALGASYYAGGGKTGFLRRLSWDKPSPTLVTNPTMPATDLAHPEKDRPLSIQEYMRIQEFPDNWKFGGTILDKYRQIGNAVPKSLGKAVGTLIVKLLKGEEILVYPDFKYSRYKITDDVSFRELMYKRNSVESEKQLELPIG